MTCTDLIQLSITVILFLTFVAVSIYAFITYKLWQQTVKQTKLSIRPIVVITYDERDRKFKYMNYGNTPAFGVKIDDFTIINTEELSLGYVVPEIYCLPQSMQISIENIKKKINDETFETELFDLGAIIPLSANRTFDVKIKYRNSENEEYITEGKVGEGTFDFTKIDKIS